MQSDYKQIKGGTHYKCSWIVLPHNILHIYFFHVFPPSVFLSFAMNFAEYSSCVLINNYYGEKSKVLSVFMKFIYLCFSLAWQGRKKKNWLKKKKVSVLSSCISWGNRNAACSWLDSRWKDDIKQLQ